jgi:hypothetical protein
MVAGIFMAVHFALSFGLSSMMRAPAAALNVQPQFLFA